MNIYAGVCYTQTLIQLKTLLTTLFKKRNWCLVNLNDMPKATQWQHQSEGTVVPSLKASAKSDITVVLPLSYNAIMSSLFFLREMERQEGKQKESIKIIIHNILNYSSDKQLLPVLQRLTFFRGLTDNNHKKNASLGCDSDWWSTHSHLNSSNLISAYYNHYSLECQYAA